MPMFEYRCESCGHEFEELVFHGQEPAQCPKCSGTVQKLLSEFSYQAPDEACAELPTSEQREFCTECRRGGGACPLSA